MDSTYVNDSTQVISLVQQKPNEKVLLEVERNENIINLEVVPSEQIRFDLGILDTKEEKSNSS